MTLSSFTGKFVIIHVAKRPGMEDVELLAGTGSDTEGDVGKGEEVDGGEDGYWNSLTG